MKLGLIGCGTIGTFLLKALNQEQKIQNLRFAQIFDIAEKQPELEAAAALNHCLWTTRFEDLLRSDVELVVEAATPEAAREYTPLLAGKGKHVLLMSVGALVEPSFLESLQQFCRKRRSLVCIPSGAVGGLDAIRAAREGEVASVSLTTRKPPGSLERAAGFRPEPVGEAPSPDKPGGKPTVVFDGSASEAIRRYPKNINVSIALSLAGIGGEATRVSMIADPAVSSNIHQIDVLGSSGGMQLQFKNAPMRGNPKTSELAALSALSALRQLVAVLGGGIAFL